MIAISLLLIIAGASTYATAQLNTFKVAPSSATLDGTANCGGTNVSFSIGCGSVPRVNTRNLQPNVAAFGEFPWQVAIVDAYEQSFLCSGVLLSHKTVLTARHCVSDVPTSDLRVRLGDWDILNDDDPRETYQSIEIPVSKKYFHPDIELTSERMNEFHSVTLLKLRRPVNFGEMPHVAPICTPLPQQLDQHLSSLRCFVAGWSESPLRPLQTWESKSETASHSRGDACDMDEASCEKTATQQEGYDSSKSRYTSNSSNQKKKCQYSTAADEKTRRPSVRVAEEDDELGEDDKWSRVLGKAQTRVVSHEECLQLNIGELDASSLCLLPSEETSHPCQADVGAPVMCELPPSMQINGKRPKHGKEREDIPTRMTVIGVVTRSYSCINKTFQGRGQDSKQQQQQKPIIATSILRVLDHVCKISGTTKK